MAMKTHEFNDTQKEACAVEIMREAVGLLAKRENVPYEDALTRFAESKVYDALFDYETGIWKEDADYLLSLYDYCLKIAG